MNALFLKLFNMSMAAGWLVLAVLLLRVLLRKAPKWVPCILWALVGIRLLVPFYVESIFSLIPSAETIPQESLHSEEPTIHSGISYLNSVVNPVISEALAPEKNSIYNPMEVITGVVAILWLIGLVVMLGYGLVSYLQIRKKVAPALLLQKNIYLCDEIDSAFILGVVRPKIYLPSVMAEEDIPHAIAHEKAHLKRLDYIWKPLGFVLLSVYWFHPLIWVAYVLLSRDIEFACDERVIKNYGTAEKKEYSQSLLSASVTGKMILRCPLAFGEVGVKERIRHVLNYKKPGFWIAFVALVVCVVVSIGFLTNPKEVLLHAPEPFCHAYDVEQVVYANPYYSSVYPMSPGSRYSFSSDYFWMRKKATSEKDADEWEVIQGIINKRHGKVKLTKENFDDFFVEAENVTGWVDGLSAKELRRNNDSAWQKICEEDETCYYLLRQKNGDVYFVYCYYEGSWGQENNKAHMRWVLKLRVNKNRDIPYGYYVTDKCLYLSPLSSSSKEYWEETNRSQRAYEFTKEELIIHDKAENAQSHYTLEWVWKDLTYSKEEWQDMAILSNMGDYMESFTVKQYQKLPGNELLFRLDDEFLIVTMGEHPDGSLHIWDMATLEYLGTDR